MSSRPLDLNHLAKLSNLVIKKAQASKLSNQIQLTLDVVSQLNQLETQGINPTPQVTGLSNIYRQDQIDQKRILTQTVALSGAKHSHNGYFVIPAIFDRQYES